jgi:TolB-like protein
MQNILVLQFACTVAGDEAEAKLARQFPLVIAGKLRATGVVETLFISLRDTVDGVVHFVNSTYTPDLAALREIAAGQGVRYVLFGKTGAGERITIDAQLYDAEQEAIVFRKFFETYAGYTIDALDEIAWRTLQQVYTGTLAEEQRIALFRRETASWEAFLYYLMAEDDYYGLQNGIIPPDLMLPVNAYIEAMKIDPTMQDAERGLAVLLIEAIERKLMPPERILETLTTVVDNFPGTAVIAQILVSLLLAMERLTEAAAEARRALETSPQSVALHRLLSDILVVEGRTGEAEQLLRNAADQYATADFLTLLADFYRMCREENLLPRAAEEEHRARTRAEEIRRREDMASLPVMTDRECSLN